MCEMMNIFSACLVLISKSFESRREWFAHANVRSTFHRFGNILNSDLIRLEVSTPSLRLYSQSSGSDRIISLYSTI